MNGINCPSCGRATDWGSTTNEWEFICKPCDARFNWAGDRMPPFETIVRFYENGTDVAPGQLLALKNGVAVAGYHTARADVVDGGCVEQPKADGETAVSRSK